MESVSKSLPTEVPWYPNTTRLLSAGAMVNGVVVKTVNSGFLTVIAVTFRAFVVPFRMVTLSIRWCVASVSAINRLVKRPPVLGDAMRIRLDAVPLRMTLMGVGVALCVSTRVSGYDPTESGVKVTRTLRLSKGKITPLPSYETT